jgi:hypothetical protein
MLRLGLLLNSRDMNDIHIESVRSMATTWNVIQLGTLLMSIIEFGETKRPLASNEMFSTWSNNENSLQVTRTDEITHICPTEKEEGKNMMMTSMNCQVPTAIDATLNLGQ